MCEPRGIGKLSYSYSRNVYFLVNDLFISTSLFLSLQANTHKQVESNYSSRKGEGSNSTLIFQVWQDVPVMGRESFYYS